MSVIQQIINHFSKNSPLNEKKLIESCKESLKKTNYVFSETDRAVLKPFYVTKVSAEDMDNIEITYRSLGKVRKDMQQFETKGVYAESPRQRKTAFDKSYQDKKSEGYSVYSVLKDDASFKQPEGFEKIYDKYLKATYKLGEVKEEGAKILLKSQGAVSMNIDFSNDVDAFLTSTLFELKNIAASNPDEYYGQIIEPSIYLATILVAHDVCGDSPAVEEITKKMAGYLNSSLTGEMSNLDNYYVKEDAIKLARARLAQLNSVLEDNEKYPNQVESFFHDLKLDVDLNSKTTDFNDLRIKWSTQGSNYNWATIADGGEEIYYTLYSDPEDLEPAKNDDEALKRLLSDDFETVLTAFEFFDRKMLEAREDKVVDTYKEAASLCMFNLVMAGFIEDPEMQRKVEEVFALPLVQCVKNLDSKELKAAEKQAIEDVTKYAEANDYDATKPATFANFDKKKMTYSKAIDNLFAKSLDVIAEVGKAQDADKAPAYDKINNPEILQTYFNMSAETAPVKRAKKSLKKRKFEIKLLAKGKYNEAENLPKMCKKMLTETLSQAGQQVSEIFMENGMPVKEIYYDEAQKLSDEPSKIKEYEKILENLQGQVREVLTSSDDPTATH